MQKLVLVLATAALAAGCATAPKGSVNQSGATAMSGKTIVQTKRPVPNFMVLKASNVALNVLLPGAGAFNAGRDLISANGVADPADAIGAALLKDLAGQGSMKVLSPALPADSTDPARISATARGQVNYVLDVQTTNWMASYFPTAWTKYRVIYSARARLIDTASGKIVSQATCKYAPESKVDAPTYDQLVEARAAGLKSALQVAANECVATLKSGMFSK